MKLLIDGREYAAVNHENASLLHLMELKQQTRDFTVDGRGLGMAALQEMGASASATRASGQVPQDADLWMAVMVFLTRRAAQEKVSFLEAIDVPVGSIDVVLEPADEPAGAAPDPTSPGPASPGTPGSEPSGTAPE